MIWDYNKMQGGSMLPPCIILIYLGSESMGKTHVEVCLDRYKGVCYRLKR